MYVSENVLFSVFFMLRFVLFFENTMNKILHIAFANANADKLIELFVILYNFSPGAHFEIESSVVCAVHVEAVLSG